MRVIPTGWWQTRRFVLGLALLSTIPLLWPAIPPLTDLPGHMGRFRVALDGARHPWLGDWYAFHWRMIGNLGVDLLVMSVAPLTGLEPAVKLIVMAIPPLTVTGFLWIAHEIHGRIPPTAFVALAFAYAFPLHFGFVNFALAMALALNAFALWLRLGAHGRTRLRAALLLPLACLIWIAHIYGWGLLGLLVAAHEIDRLRTRQTSLAAALVAGLPLCLPIGMMLIWRGNDDRGTWSLAINWFEKVAWLAMPLADRWRMFDFVATILVYGLLLAGLFSPRLSYARSLGLAVAVLAIAYLLIPRFVFGSGYADMRLLPYIVGIAVVALAPATGLPVRDKSRIAAAALAFAAIRLAGTTASLGLYDRDYDRQLAALDHVPIGARLVSFVGEDCRDIWFRTRLRHLPGLALERRLAYANDQWVIDGTQLLTPAYAAAGAYRSDPSQYVAADDCPVGWGRPLSQALRGFPRAAFDYVWLIDPPAYSPALIKGLSPVWRSGSSVLLRVDHPPRR
jgi:hypothetical protein